MKPSLSQMDEYLNALRIPIRLACSTKTGWPMVISLWFLHQDGLIYCATQKTAKIIRYLENDSRCAFEIAEDQPPYCGIRGQARASLDYSKGAEILDKLLIRYLGGKNNDLAKKLLRKSEEEVAIVLKPNRIFTWNFSTRMKDLRPQILQEKICP